VSCGQWKLTISTFSQLEVNHSQSSGFLFPGDPVLVNAPCAPWASVSVEDFRQVVSALEDKYVEVTKANFSAPLWFSEKLLAFRQSAFFKNMVMKKAEGQEQLSVDACACTFF
jgi:hypothetical protein